MTARDLLLAATAICALAGCTVAEDEPAPEPVAEVDATAEQQPPAPPPDPEPIELTRTAWSANDAQGTLYTTHFDPDNTYRDYRDGLAHQTGRWDQPGPNRACLLPDASDERTCWSLRPLGGEGAMRVTGPDDVRATLREVDYRDAEAMAEADGPE